MFDDKRDGHAFDVYLDEGRPFAFSLDAYAFDAVISLYVRADGPLMSIGNGSIAISIRSNRLGPYIPTTARYEWREV